jgi:hypothetical protein
MSLGALIPRRPKVGPVTFQCSVREGYSSQATVTSNPVAFGSIITDHVQVQPEVITLDVIASTDISVGLGVFQGPGAASRTYQAIKALQRARILVDVVTGMGVFSKYVITGLETFRDAEFSGGFSGALRFSITLQQVVIALVDEIENVATAAADLSIGAADVGAQGTEALPVPAF